LAALDHNGSRVLPRGGRGSARQTRQSQVFNTDQGSQFTGADFTGLLLDNAIAISMDGNDRLRMERDILKKPMANLLGTPE
jgi:putative transposase